MLKNKRIVFYIEVFFTILTIPFLFCAFIIEEISDWMVESIIQIGEIKPERLR